MTASPETLLRSGTLYPVQYLRAAAALVVMLFHVSILSHETWQLDARRVDHVGAAGVDLFFAISGFIMAMIVFRPDEFDGRDFWIRRVAWVVPAYWMITGVVFVLAALVPSLFNSTTADIPHLLASLFFLAVNTGNGSTVPLLVVGWTVNYEMFFYLIVAITAGLFSDRRLLGASGVIVGLVLAGIVFNPVQPSLAFYSNPILLEFVFGVLVFRTWSRTGSAGLSFAPVTVFALGALLLFLQWERPLVDWRAFYWGVPAAAVLYGGVGALTFRNEFLARLGDWSYALYLTHLFVITFYIKHVISSDSMIELPWPAHYLIMTVAVFATAGIYHRLVERLLSAWVLDKLRRRPPHPVVPHAATRDPAE
ncbi:acyltransferase [Hoeflea sp.]|uniref:acyltransferase family protein n=1 Tax=Hoeflea sp. TaxID=1940281 RepID=UPI00198FDB4B|nr:acyltransferase [Hoeflea sp.]MBC7284392.1 acyltransferase [Hoeflea sp.]